MSGCFQNNLKQNVQDSMFNSKHEALEKCKIYMWVFLPLYQASARSQKELLCLPMGSEVNSGVKAQRCCCQQHKHPICVGLTSTHKSSHVHLNSPRPERPHPPPLNPVSLEIYSSVKGVAFHQLPKLDTCKTSPSPPPLPLTTFPTISTICQL